MLVLATAETTREFDTRLGFRGVSTYFDCSSDQGLNAFATLEEVAGKQGVASCCVVLKKVETRLAKLGSYQVRLLPWRFMDFPKIWTS